MNPHRPEISFFLLRRSIEPRFVGITYHFDFKVRDVHACFSEAFQT